MRVLSHTQISAYLECPLKYKFKYIDGLKEKPKGHLIFGSSVHRAMEFLYNVKLPKPPSLEDVLKHYKDKWMSEGYKDLEEEKEYFAFGESMVREFYEKHIGDYRVPLGVEQTIHFEVDGVKIKAIIDRIDKISDSELEIVDYKTSRNPFSLSYLSKEPQLTMYQLAVECEYGLRVEKLTYYHLRSQTPFSVPRHGEAEIAELRSRVARTASGIENADFPPKENRYCPCDFAHMCPLYMHEYKKEEPGNKKVIDIAKAADDYGVLKDKVKELDAKAEALKGEIKEYMNSENMERVFGDKYEVTRSKSSHERLDSKKAKEVLVKNNMLEGLIKFIDSEKILYKERKEEISRG